jgi:hypothetical protein
VSQPDEWRGDDDVDHVETIGRWVTVRQAAEDVGRSVDWVRRQYRAGVVESRVQPGRYGPERLIDIEELRVAAESPKPGAAPAAAPLPMLAETVHELARQLGEAQERAARAEAEAEELRRALDAAERRLAARDASAPDAPAGDDADEALWVAANAQFLRTLPGTTARQDAGKRLVQGGGVEVSRGGRRRWRRS